VCPLYGVTFMEIDDDTLKQLLRINDELMQLCKWLNEKRDMETSSRLIPLVDDLTHILIEAARTNYSDAATRRIFATCESWSPNGRPGCPHRRSTDSA
jgi:hypothetical protein